MALPTWDAFAAYFAPADDASVKALRCALVKEHEEDFPPEKERDYYRSAFLSEHAVMVDRTDRLVMMLGYFSTQLDEELITITTGSDSATVTLNGETHTFRDCRLDDERFNSELARFENLLARIGYTQRLSIEEGGAYTLVFLPLPVTFWQRAKAQYGEARIESHFAPYASLWRLSESAPFAAQASEPSYRLDIQQGSSGLRWWHFLPLVALAGLSIARQMKLL